jgi:hypothetical protein
MQGVIILGGSILALTPILALMVRANRSERRHRSSMGAAA